MTTTLISTGLTRTGCDLFGTAGLGKDIRTSTECSRDMERDERGLRSMGVNTQEQYFEVERQGVMSKCAVAAGDLRTLLNNMPRIGRTMVLRPVAITEEPSMPPIGRGELDSKSEIAPRTDKTLLGGVLNLMHVHTLRHSLGR